MARESMVLLKNNGILPLKNVKKIAVIGPNADDREVLLGNYNGYPSKYTTLLEGIRKGTDAEIIHSKGCHIFSECPHTQGGNIREAIINAEKSDVVIMCMGLNPSLEGEQGDAYNTDASGDKIDLELPKVQRQLIEAVVKTGKPVVFVNVSGSAVNLSFEKENCDALIQCFYPGAEGGNALADILFGKVSPSGRLPVTFYKSIEDLPPFEDYSMKNRTYKFFDGEPIYPFGFGLNYSEITEEWIDENTVILTNNGEYDVNYSVLKFEYIPHKNLCGFKKQFIKSGETLRVKF